MMDKLMKNIRYAVDAEQQEAEKNHGRTFASAHEGYGVLAEELQEATDEEENVMTSLGKLLYAIRQDSVENIENVCLRIERCAMLAACEYCQVAAMARKMILTMNESKEA